MSDVYIGDGWELETRPPFDMRPVFNFSSLLPDAPWFWRSLQTLSDGGYQGLDEFVLSHESVRWACGDNVDPPAGYYPWSDVRRDVRLSKADERSRNAQFAIALRGTAAAVRDTAAPYADANIFGVPARPESWATLLSQLADWVEQPIPSPDSPPTTEVFREFSPRP